MPNESRYWILSEAYIKTKIQNYFFSKLRASSHDLEVKRGRYVRPKLDVNERLCISYHVIEDEEHFITDCVNNRGTRKKSLREPGFANRTNREEFVFLMSCGDPQISSWFSIFLPLISYSQPEDVTSCLVNAIESCVIIFPIYCVVIRFYLYIPILS